MEEQTFYQTIVRSEEWKKWEEYNYKHFKWDVDESRETG